MTGRTTQNSLREALQKIVDAGELAGAATLTYRNGSIETACVGWRDREAGLPIEPDTLFRIASLSKPILSVAALMLADEGRIALDDPISRYAPEFAKMQVLHDPDGPLEAVEPAQRPITFEDLLTHRAGFTYGDFHRGPIRRAYRTALGLDIDSDLRPDDWIARLAGLPLISQPGSAMCYGSSTDLLGFLIARIEGARLSEVLRRRVFAPLGMHDTGFFVAAAKRHRRAAAYGFDENGKLMKRATWGAVVVEERPAEMEYESGGAGLWSTVEDYAKFARVFLGDGSVDGVRLLKPETLARMMTNQLTGEQRSRSKWLGRKPFAVGRGFGLGVAVVLETDPSDMMRRGGVGSVGWPGAFGGWWEADPQNGSVRVFLAHNMVELVQMAQGIGLGVWAAIEAFQKLSLTVPDHQS